MRMPWGPSLLIGLLGAAPAGALPVLSEVLYDAVGSDDGFVFVEIHAEAGASLDGLVIEGINGSDGGVTVSLALSGVIPADGLYVLADDAGGGVSSVSGADQILDFDFQKSLRARATTCFIVAFLAGASPDRQLRVTHIGSTVLLLCHLLVMPR